MKILSYCMQPELVVISRGLHPFTMENIIIVSASCKVEWFSQFYYHHKLKSRNLEKAKTISKLSTLLSEKQLFFLAEQ